MLARGEQSDPLPLEFTTSLFPSAPEHCDGDGGLPVGMHLSMMVPVVKSIRRGAVRCGRWADDVPEHDRRHGEHAAPTAACAGRA